MDQTDCNIIQILEENSRITMKKLGEKVHLTGQAAATRVAKLEEEGIIEGYTIKLNEMKRGYPVHAFLTIYMDKISHSPYLEFVKENDQIIRNHYKISGDGCYLMECRFKSNEHLNPFLESLNRYANYKLTLVIAN